MKRIVSLLLITAVLFCAAPCVLGAEPALSDLKPEPVALVIGGSQITKGRGFSKAVTWLTEEDLNALYLNHSGEITYKYGLGDSFLEHAVTYSTFENHGTPEWVYRRVLGLDITLMAQALGVDTNQALSVAVNATDGSSKVLADAFGVSVSRYYYGTDGTIVQAVGPVLALYETSVSTQITPAPGAALALPVSPATGLASPHRVAPIFGYGQTAVDEINSCYWVKYVNKLRIGPERSAIKCSSADGKTTSASLSSIVLMGVYKTSYPDGSAIDQVSGIPLDTLLAQLSFSVPKGGSLTAADESGQTKTLSEELLSRCFVAWDATRNGASVSNATPLRLYTPEGVVADLVSLTAAAPETPPAFTDLDGYGWAADSINALKAQGIVTGTGETAFSPAQTIQRGDFILMLARAYALKGGAGNFADVEAGSYFYDAIAAAKSLGIAVGDGVRFHPNDPITRQDAMVLLYRTLETQGTAFTKQGDCSAFSDEADIAPYAKEALSAFVGAGILTGDGAKLNPTGLMTRAELAVALHRVLTVSL